MLALCTVCPRKKETILKLAQILNFEHGAKFSEIPMFDIHFWIIVSLIVADYPLCAVSKPVKQLLVRTLNQCSNKTLELFFEHCLQSMINDMGKGENVLLKA